MSETPELFHTYIYFRDRDRPAEVLLSKADAEVIMRTVVNQSSGYNISSLNWVTGEYLGSMSVNGRNIDYVISNPYTLPKR